MYLTDDDYKPLGKFNADTSKAPKDVTIMGQIKGTYRHVAVKWSQEDQAFHAVGLAGEPVVEIISWLGFTDFADIRQCVWSDSCAK
jgi:hypothetical protein